MKAARQSMKKGDVVCSKRHLACYYTRDRRLRSFRGDPVLKLRSINTKARQTRIERTFPKQNTSSAASCSAPISAGRPQKLVC